MEFYSGQPENPAASVRDYCTGVLILDLYSRRVIGWAVSNRMKRDLAIRALDMAVALRQPPEGCMHHTDRGSQYCSHDYQKRLKKHGFKVSMSDKGNCYDCEYGIAA